MRFMILGPATKQSEAGVLPDEAALEAMWKYTAELAKAGVLLGGEGLQPTSKGVRLIFEASRPPRVIDGPFTESKELIAGYSIIQVSSKEEAVEWVKRMPLGKLGDEKLQVEIRQLFEPADFAPSDPTGEIGKTAADIKAKIPKRT